MRADAVRAYLDVLLERACCTGTRGIPIPRPERLTLGPCVGAVRPEALMVTIQDVVVDRHDAIVLAESGNSFIWAASRPPLRLQPALSPEHPRRIDGPCRGAGVVGAAEGSGVGKAVAIVGDGAMLMNSEINTAVKLTPAVWSLNVTRATTCVSKDGRFGSRRTRASPRSADFAMLARAP